MTICPTCHIDYEPVDYPVVWPWPGSCLCSTLQRESVAKERRRAQLQRIELTPATHGARAVRARQQRLNAAPTTRPARKRGIDLGAGTS